ncbi:unnamed protein product [Camellia sinensis]
MSNINMNISIMESLSHFITEPELVRIAGNPRHKLFALLGPTDSWTQFGPTIYCLVQVSLEGEIPAMPVLNEEDPLRVQIKEVFEYFPQLPSDSLIGVRIVHVFALPDALEEEYQSTSLKLLTRYYNGHMAQDVVEEVPQREANFLTQLRQKKGRVHYIGVCTNPSSEDLDLWESRGFKILFVGHVKSMVEITCVMIIPLHDYEAHVARHFGNCSFDELFRAFSCIFIGALAYLVIDHFFALRILRRNIELIQQGEPVPAKKPWENLTDEKRIEAFIRRTHPIELVIHLVPSIARAYFGGSLPVLLSTDQECVLFLLGLRCYLVRQVKEVLHLTDDEILQHMRGVFRDVLDCFNTLSPEVVDEGSSGAVV